TGQGRCSRGRRGGRRPSRGPGGGEQGPPSSWSGDGGQSRASSRSYVHVHHFAPVRPIVRPTVPDVQRGRYPFALEDAGETLGFLDVGIIAAGRDDDLGRAKRLDIAVGV